MKALWSALQRREEETEHGRCVVLTTTDYGEPFELHIPIGQLDRFVDLLTGAGSSDRRRNELFAKAEAAMSDWYGYHDVQNPWCGGEVPDLEFDGEYVDDWRHLFELLARAWGLIEDDTIGSEAWWTKDL